MIAYRIVKDRAFGAACTVLCLLALLLVVGMGVGLFLKSSPVLEEHGLWELLSASSWRPMKGEFGFLPFIGGTVWVTLLATLIALPISLLTAIFITEYSWRPVRKIAYPVLDILSSLPSVIYGMWGSLVIVPLIAKWSGGSGYTVLAAGIVLAVMIVPLMVSLFVEIFNSVSQELRDAAMSLGSTRWQTVRRVVIRKTLPGLFAALVLSISRALGETIAVLMVCGNLAELPHSVLDACYPIPALIANNYGEMLSMPLYEAALMFASLILFATVLIFNLFSQIILKRIK